MFGKGVSMNHGVAKFSQLEAYCSPLGNVTVRFQATLGSLTIIPASERTPYYISNTSFFSFRKCQAGEYENVNGLCETCASGSYSLFEKSEECNSCVDEEGVVACGSSEIELKEGYWRRYDTNTAVQLCLLDPTSCPGGTSTGDQSCAPGYEGPLCAICSDGYFLTDNTCQVCETSNKITPTAIALIIISAAISGLVFLLWYGKDSENERIIALQIVMLWLQMKYSEMVGKIKIIISTFQIIIATSMIFQVQMPTSFNLFANSFKFLNLSLGSIIPFGCTQDFNYMDTLLLTTIFPIAIGVALVAAYFTEGYLLPLVFKQYSQDQSNVSSIKMKYLNYFFYVTYLILPSLTTTIFQIFICTNVDPNHEDNDEYDWYLVADMSISCETNYYRDWIVYAVFMIILYPIGIPVLYFYLLYRFRKEIQHRDDAPVAKEEDTTLNPITSRASEAKKVVDDHKPNQDLETRTISEDASKLAFLWEAYSPKFWYWEIIETFRRLILTAVLSVCFPGTSSQTVFGSLLAIFFIKLYAQFNPYADNADGTLAEIGQWQIFVTFFTALVVQNSLVNSTLSKILGVLIVLLNLSIFIATLYYQAQQYQEDKRIAEEQAQQERLSMMQFRQSQRIKIQKAVGGQDSLPSFQRKKHVDDVNKKEGDSDDDVAPVPVVPAKPAFRRRSVQTLDSSVAAFDQAVRMAAKKQQQQPKADVEVKEHIKDHPEFRRSEQGFELKTFTSSPSVVPQATSQPSVPSFEQTPTSSPSNSVSVVDNDTLRSLNDNLRQSLSSKNNDDNSFRSSVSRKDVELDSDDEDV